MKTVSGIAILFIFLLNSFSSRAQNVYLHGRVTDALSDEPVKGAVILISGKYSAGTNSDGFYSITGLEQGNLEIEVIHMAYESFSAGVKIAGDTALNFSLLPSPIEMGEVIVSTSRIDRNLRNSPYSELMISTNEIQDRNFQSLPEALEKEPGISLISEGVWGTELNIRGLSRENVVALIDGNRVSTSTDVAARFSLVDLNDVERVEIIKGASSALYGSGATGGIVNIITKSPSFTDVFSVNGHISSGYNSVNNSSISSGSVFSGGKSLAAKLTGSFRKAGNLRTPSGKIKNSQFADFGIAGNLNLAMIQNHLLKLNYQLFKANDVGIPGSSVFPENADVRYPEEKRELFSAGYEVRNISSSLYKLSIKYSYQFIERDVENLPHIMQNFNATQTSPARRVSLLKITPGADHRSNNFQFFGNFLIGESSNLVLGIDYWDRKYTGERQRHQLIEILDSAGNVINSTSRILGEKPLPDSKFTSLGFFAQDDAEIIKDKLLLTFGARADRIEVNGSTTLNPVYEITNGIINNVPSNQQVIWNEIKDTDYSYSFNFGVKYSVIENLDLTLSTGYSFRSPSLEERFQYIDQGSVVRVGHPNLNSEKGRSIDLGIRYYSPKIKIISSFFFNYFNELVAEIPGTFEGRNALIKTNIGESRLYGFDISADYNLITDFILSASASYVKGDDITADGNLPEIPPLNGRTGIRYKLLNNLESEFTSSIFASQEDIAAGEMKTPGYGIFNAAVYINSLNLSALYFKISAGIENIFNKSYRSHLSTARGSITQEPGRNIYLKLILNW